MVVTLCFLYNIFFLNSKIYFVQKEHDIYKTAKIISHSVKSGIKSTYFMHNYGRDVCYINIYCQNDYLCTVCYFCGFHLLYCCGDLSSDLWLCNKTRVFFLLFKGHVLIFLYAENIEGILELLSKHLRPLASRAQYRACKKMPSIIITSIIRLSSFLEN